MKQCNKILKSMLYNPDKKVWYAKDFQYGEHFIGYEASARMSDVVRMYPDIFIVGKDGRFRTLEIDWTKEKEIKEIKEMLELENEDANS